MRGPRRVGILGGTFDPIHNGHLDAGCAAERALALTEVIVVTASAPPHRTPVASVYHRFAMAALAIAGHGTWSLSELELDLTGPSYTTETLQRFEQLGYDRSELYFVIGADAFVEIESWKDYPAILDRAHFAVVSRPGLAVGEVAGRLPRLAHRFTRPDRVGSSAGPVVFLVDAPTSGVSSTAIREKCAAGQPIGDLVPPLVGQHIERHGLYREAADSRRPQEAGHRAAAGRLHGQK